MPDPNTAGASRMTLTPSSIQIIQTQGYEETITEQVTISPEPEGSQFFAVVAADKPVVQTGQVFLAYNADHSVTATMQTERTLSEGTHEGELIVHLCRDPQCQDEVSLTGNVLPYSIKVLPQVRLSVDGVLEPPTLGNTTNHWIDSGTTVVITSSIPVAWSRGSSTSSTELQVISSTPTRWEGVIRGYPNDFVGVVASALEKPLNSAMVLFDIR
jgi:hypothetical protein